MKKIPPAVPYEIGLYEDLQDPDEAALYLTAAFQDGDPDVILLALHDVAKARGMSQIAKTVKVHRVSLHKMLRKNGNPTLRTLLALLAAFKVRISISNQKSRAA